MSCDSEGKIVVTVDSFIKNYKVSSIVDNTSAAFVSQCTKSNQEVLIQAFIISLHKTKQSTGMPGQRFNRRLHFFKGGRVGGWAIFCFCSFKEETKVHSTVNKQEK